MRRICILVLLFAFAPQGTFAQDSTRFADDAAQNLFVRSRAAVVHTGTVTQLRSLILRGHLRTTADNGSPLDGAIEIKVLLPDNFLRVETYADVQRFTGFTGKALLTAMREGNRVELPPDNATAALLRVTRAHFTRFMLGIATYITTDRQMTMRSSGGAPTMVDPRDSARAAVVSSTPQSAAGSAVVTNSSPEPFSLDVQSDNFFVRFVVDSITRMPVQLVFPGARQEPTTMAFGNRRTVGGFDLPYLMTTTVGHRVLERVVFDEILVNRELSQADFRIDRDHVERKDR
jgi:hypothetical protein